MKRILKNFFILFVFILILITISLSQTKGIFWEVKSDSTTIYILGSIHYGTKKLYPLMNEIEEAFKKSQVLVVEADITNPNLSYKLQEAILKKGIYLPNDSIKNHISGEVFKLLEEYFGEELLKSLEMFKPWVLYFLIGPENIDLNPKLGINMYFIEKAKNLRKEIIEMEGIDYQINLFSDFSEKDQENLIKMSLLELKREDYNDKINSLIDAYIKGDEKKIEDIVLEEYSKTPEYKYFYEKFYLERNKLMLEKIKNFLKDKKIYFIVIGAGHLIGEEGIIENLIRDGYRVERIF